MTTSPSVLSDVVMYDTLVNYLVSMARTVEGAMNRALDAIVGFDNPRTSVLPSEVFLLEPRINEMEIVIDEHAIRLLRSGNFSDDELRLIVAALKITNDLERIGDIAVNLAQRVISLREMPGAQVPEELAPMAAAVRAMVSKSLGALIFRNADMATHVLESDDLVDRYRDRIFEQLLERMTHDTQVVSPGLQFILATRHLERIADHATNIAEDIIYWVRGLDVRHGRLLLNPQMPAPDTLSRVSDATAESAAGNSAAASSATSTADGREGVTNNSHGLYSRVTPG
jgi:phosphate transport system protein